MKEQTKLFPLFAAFLMALILAACSTNRPVPTVERTPDLKRGKVVMVNGEVQRQAATPRAAPGPVVASTTPGTHVVQQGETLYSIAVRNGVSASELAAWNGLSDPTQIAVGQELRLTPPAGTMAATTAPLDSETPVGQGYVDATSGALPTDNTTKPFRKNTPKAIKEPYSEQRRVAMLNANQPAVTPETSGTMTTAPAIVPPATPNVTPGTAPTLANITSPSGISDAVKQWIWPTQGKVISRFSESASLKGIDIVGAIGQPVVASAAGRVVYVGSGLRGYGKLVIVKHNETFLTVYAHNREIYVKQGDNVRQGQKIAEMGNTDADQVKLHFEVRQDGKPVDPLKYLPAK